MENQPSPNQPSSTYDPAIVDLQPAAGVHYPPAPQPIIIQQNNGLFGRMVALLGWAGFMFCGLWVLIQGVTIHAAKDTYFDTTEGITVKHHSGATSGKQKIAIISVTGLIMEGDGYVKKQINRVLKDEDVKAVVLRVDTPGGTVTGSDYIFHHLKKLRKEKNIPIVVSMGSMATSGGYYVSMAVGDQEDSIFAEPTTMTGSIGVIIPHYDLSGLMERYDIKDDSIASHPRKQMLSMTREIPPEHREIIQAMIDNMFERFKDIVREGRPALREDGSTLTEIATGEMFTTDQAIKYGLVDKIGFIEDAIDRAIELADLQKDKVSVIEFEQPQSLFSLPMIQSLNSSSDLSTLLEMSAPRAYYLTTSLPTLISTQRALQGGR